MTFNPHNSLQVQHCQEINHLNRWSFFFSLFFTFPLSVNQYISGKLVFLEEHHSSILLRREKLYNAGLTLAFHNNKAAMIYHTQMVHHMSPQYEDRQGQSIGVSLVFQGHSRSHLTVQLNYMYFFLVFNAIYGLILCASQRQGTPTKDRK